MILDVAQHIPSEFNDSSRVWIYQSSRLFTLGEAFEIEKMLESFIPNWNSHGAPVKAYGNLFFGQFIVLMADEQASAGVSGCSTDSSVKLIKDIEQTFKVNMFDRQTLAFYYKEKVQTLPLAHFKHAIENGFITPDTLYFNNTVLNKKDLKNNWIIPVKESWLAGKLKVES